MDFREYIESGKLEFYVLGNCTNEEILEAECMARIFPEVRYELEQLRSFFEKDALANKIEPPVELKSRILAAINEMDTSTGTSEAKVLSIAPNTPAFGSAFRYLIAACLLLFIICGFVIFNLYSRNNNLTTHIDELEFQQKTAAKNYAEQQNLVDKSQRQLLAIINPNSIPVVMKGLPLSPQSQTTVYWNRDSQEVYLSINFLPKPPLGMQYQLWGIVNNAPIDLGVFEMPDQPDSQLLKMKFVDGIKTFAVTLEKSGGSLVPTLSEMYVMGSI